MRSLFGGMLAVAASLVAPASAHAAECRAIDVDFLPQESPNADPGTRRPLQIVAWIETPSGEFVETVFITQQVGTYGLGNRPGRFDFNSGPLWPYGRRTTVFPVWAHRHGLSFPELVFQDGQDDNLSHISGKCSTDPHYCAPLLTTEPEWDTGTCASVPFTDKGTFGTGQSLYPPREDVIRKVGNDAPSVDEYEMLNPFDAVSKASPKSGVPAAFTWTMPADFPAGDFVMWLEVSREFDQNATYSVDRYPGPQVAYGNYGVPYRGQPSVIYRVPFTVGNTETSATTLDWYGYGDPDGIDGAIRQPDGTITIDTPGSGAQRLGIVPGGNYRVRVNAGADPDFAAPAGPSELSVSLSRGNARISFIAPGDDGVTGRVTGYEVRYLVGSDVTEDNFATAIVAKPAIDIVDAGALQELELEKLLPETTYSVGIRALDNCGNAGPVSVISFTTPSRASGEVDACFIATAAYGSLMANDVEQLRRFRDLALSHSVLGQLAITTYYTFSPPVAGVVGESEVLRTTARTWLGPIVSAVRGYRF